MELARIEAELKNGASMEELLGRIGWKEFESFCAQVMQRHGWNTKLNFRFKTRRRFEIDILAEKGGIVIAADCKHWGIRPGKTTQLRHAAEDQKERVRELSTMGTLDMEWGKRGFHALIITMLQEDVRKEGDAWIVPAASLNEFLLNIEKYLEF